MSSTSSESTSSNRTTTITDQRDNRVGFEITGGSAQNVSGVENVIGDITLVGEGGTNIEQNVSATPSIIVNFSRFNSAGGGETVNVSGNTFDIVQNISANDPRVAQDALAAARAFLEDTTFLIDSAGEGARDLFADGISQITDLFSTATETNAKTIADANEENRKFLGDILDGITASQGSTLEGVSGFAEDVLQRLSETQGDSLESVTASIAELRAANENNAALTRDAVEALANTRVSEGSQLVDALPKLAMAIAASAAAVYVFRKAA